MSKHSRNSRNSTHAATPAAEPTARGWESTDEQHPTIAEPTNLPPEQPSTPVEQPSTPAELPAAEEPTEGNTPMEGTELMTPEQLIAEEAKAAGITVEELLARKQAEAAKPVKVDRWPDRTKKSTISSPVKMVWHIADAMIAQNPDVRRKDVVQAAINQGIAGYTARTQYQAWFTARRESMKAAAEVAAKQAAQAK